MLINLLDLEWFDAMKDGLVLRGSRYSVVVNVPKDLLTRIGKKQVWKSLGTGDKVEARRRSLKIRTEIFGNFERERLALSGAHNDRKFSDEQLERLAKELYEYEMSKFEAEQLGARQGELRVAARWRNTMLEAKPAYLNAMQNDISIGEFHHASWWVDHVIQRDGLTIIRDGPDYRHLAYICQRVLIDAIKVQLARYRGDYSVMPGDPIVVNETIAGSDERICDLFARYVLVNPGAVKPDKLNTDKYSVDLFVEYIGDISPSNVERSDVRNWRNLLSDYPARAAQMTCFAGMKIEEVIEANKAINKPIISRRTVNKHLSAISAFFNWCISEGYRDEANPCDKLSFAKEKTATVRSFTAAELEVVFADKWFAGDRDHRFWLPVIALYSGARLGEIAQMNKEDVRMFHNRICFHFTDVGDGEKSIKHPNSARVVPVHNVLLELGFSEYTETIAGGKIFPNVTKNSRGQWASNISRDFGRLLKRLGLKNQSNRPKLDFHSFRHTFADRMRSAGFADDEFDILLGHKGSITGRYGNDKAHVIERKCLMIDALEYQADLPGILAKSSN